MKEIFILLFLLTLTFQILIISGHIYSLDEEVTFQTARSIVENFSTDIEHTEKNHFYCKKGVDNKYYSKFGIGFSLFLVPFIITGKFISIIFGLKQTNLLYFVSSFANIIVISLIVAVFCLLVWNISKNRKISIILSLTLGFSTFLMPYGRTLFNDPFCLLNLTLSIYFFYLFKAALQTQNLRERYLFYSGIFSGLMFATRFEYTIIIPGISLLFLNLLKTNKKSLYKIIFYIVPVVVIFLFLGLYNHTRFGRFYDTGIYNQDPSDKFSTPLFVGLSGMLLSPGKGIIFYAPVIILSIWGLKDWIKTRGIESFIILFFIILPVLILHSKWHSWMGGWSWGPRRLIGILTLLLLPAINALASILNKRENKLLINFILVIFLTGFLIQVPGFLVNFMDYIEWAQSQRHSTIYELTWSPYIGHIRYLLSGAEPDLF
ncbi:MAG: hypothetical protein AB1765_12300, partial [Candidatus Hydrogenedentota bacterium]